MENTNDAYAYLDYCETWRKSYRGVYFEIVRWNYRGEDKCNWNYYVYLKERHFANKELWGEIWNGADPSCKSEGVARFWLGLEIHGGITFYERNAGHKYVKVGCDYGHWGDYEYEYDLGMVLCDCQNTIDGIHAKCDYLINDAYDGGVHLENDGEYQDIHMSMFYSHETIANKVNKRL